MNTSTQVHSNDSRPPLRIRSRQCGALCAMGAVCRRKAREENTSSNVRRVDTSVRKTSRMSTRAFLFHIACAPAVLHE